MIVWLSLLRRNWLYLLIAATLIAGAWYLRQSGYESGYKDRDSYWRPKFDTAEKARAAADARAEALDAASKALSIQHEARHAKEIEALSVRASESQRRIVGLMRQLASGPGDCPVSKTSGSAEIPYESPAGDEFLAAIGGDLAEMARRCESDAAQLAALQSWVREQIALLQ